MPPTASESLWTPLKSGPWKQRSTSPALWLQDWGTEHSGLSWDIDSMPFFTGCQNALFWAPLSHCTGAPAAVPISSSLPQPLTAWGKPRSGVAPVTHFTSPHPRSVMLLPPWLHHLPPWFATTTVPTPSITGHVSALDELSASLWFCWQPVHTCPPGASEGWSIAAALGLCLGQSGLGSPNYGWGEGGGCCSAPGPSCTLRSITPGGSPEGWVSPRSVSPVQSPPWPSSPAYAAAQPSQMEGLVRSSDCHLSTSPLLI